MVESMFHLELPLLEKIVRPVLVYLVLVIFLRLFGKRELAQLNPFDLVVLLCLANTVQNAIIGNDNSVSGGIVGAFSLLTTNWLLVRFLYKMPRINQALEGSPAVLICDGKLDRAAMVREQLTEVELLSVIHKQGMDDLADVQRCVLEPNGTFYVEAKKPSSDDLERREILELVRALKSELALLRVETRGAAS